jgi:hypothetical protein
VSYKLTSVADSATVLVERSDFELRGSKSGVRLNYHPSFALGPIGPPVWPERLLDLLAEPMKRHCSKFKSHRVKNLYLRQETDSYNKQS